MKIQQSLWLCLAFFLVAGLLVFAHSLKQELLSLDARYLNDFVWTATHKKAENPHLQKIPPPAPGAYDWLPKSTFFPIAHALGASDLKHANTLNALERSYSSGVRLFEVDIMVTRDNQLICRHDTPNEISDKFMLTDYLVESRRLGRHPCVFADLLASASRHPDIRFVLDVKNRYDDAYLLMRHQIGQSGLGRRFIPQLYSFSQLPQFRSDGFFAGPLFTSAFSRLSTHKIFQFAHKYGIPVVTLPADRLDRLEADEISAGPPFVLGHPMDNEEAAADWRKKGVRGIYTYSLFPLEVPQLYRE